MIRINICVFVGFVSLATACSDGSERQVGENDSSAVTQTDSNIKSQVDPVDNAPAEDPAIAMANYSFARSDVDIVGLKLGMTGEQVTRIIKAHDHKITIQAAHRPIQYLALNENRDAGKYLSRIAARHLGSSREFINAYFLAPPHDAKVFALTRYYSYETHNHQQEILADDFRASLIEKYGEPHADKSNSNQIIFHWYLTPELVDCPLGFPMATTIAPYQPRLPVHFAEHKDTCGAFLEAKAPFSPTTGLVHNAEVGLVDFKGLNKTWFDYHVYVDELSRRATEEKRQQLKGANKPTL